MFSSAVGSLNGGSVWNGGDVVVNGYKASKSLFFSISFNNDSHNTWYSLLDQGGSGGYAISGAAIGGNAHKRGATAGKGGNAQSGHSGNVNGSDIENYGGFIINSPFASKYFCLICFFSDFDHNLFVDTGGKGGVTQSGVAVGGNGKGGGGSALSGSTGSSNGSSVLNSGSVIVNGYKSSMSFFLIFFGFPWFLSFFSRPGWRWRICGQRCCDWW